MGFWNVNVLELLILLSPH